MSVQTKVAIIGSGNIGTDLMFKILRRSRHLAVGGLAGVDPASEGLARAKRLGVVTTDRGIDGLRELDCWPEVQIVFDATSAAAHARHQEICLADGKIMIDLTPAAVGPYVVPVVNGDAHLNAQNLNMVTCGGQATIPIVAAVSSVARVRYAEIVASIASKSAGPGTRANIDEFTETTSRAIAAVGGSDRGKAIIILNPAEPPLVMRDTVYCLAEGGEPATIKAAIEKMVESVQVYVPGYRLKQEVQIERIGDNQPIYIPDMSRNFTGYKVTTFLEVEGSGDYLPTYAGNLDIMTSAALNTAERVAAARAGAVRP